MSNDDQADNGPGAPDSTPDADAAEAKYDAAKEAHDAAETELKELDALAGEYRRLMHAMQSGVALKLQADPTDASPKHLRLGVNSCLVDTSAIARLLISKGVITEREYLGALVDAAWREVDAYEKDLLNKYGIVVKLA